MNGFDPRWPFFSLDVELTTKCERSCAFCPHEQLTRPRGEMSGSTWARILAESIIHGSRIAFSGMGDPFECPTWDEKIVQARKARLTAGIVVPAGSLSEERANRLVVCRPSFVEVSFPSLRPEVFRTLQPRDPLEDALEKVLMLRRLGGDRFPLVIVGLQTGLNVDEETEFLKIWASHGIQSRMFPCHSRGRNLDKQELIQTTRCPESGCGLFARHSFVAWSGELLACCHDLRGETRLGDVNQSSFQDLGMVKTGILEGRMPFPLCTGCDECRRGWPLPLQEAFPVTASGRKRALRRLASADK